MSMFQVEDSNPAVFFQVVSNHGGRQLDSTPATIDVLPAIAAEVKGEVGSFLGDFFRAMESKKLFRRLTLRIQNIVLRCEHLKQPSSQI